MNNIERCPICDHGSLVTFLSTNDFANTKETFTLKQCKACNFVLTAEQPSVDELSKYYDYGNYISHQHRAYNFIDKLYFFVRDYTLKQKLRLVNDLNTGTTRNILDFGCGTGDFLKTCKQSGWLTFGVEPMAQARTLAIQNGIANATASLEVIKTEVDVITLWHVLEHVSDLNTTIRELKKRLNQNGTLIIAVPNRSSWDAKHYGEFWAGYDVPRHLWHFSKEDIKNIASRHSLALIGIKPMLFDSSYVSLLSEKYKRGRQTTTGIMTAAINGLRSNLYARANGNYSSLIYILKHEA
jgi:SAM-dependent methyltransferase